MFHTLSQQGAVWAAAATLLLAACDGGPTAPRVDDPTTPSVGLQSDPEPDTTVTTPSAPGGGEAHDSTAAADSVGLVPRKWPIEEDVTASAWIGPEGGQVQIGATGFLLEIPAGALAQPTEITVTAKAGRYELYEFGPHGLEFDLPVKMHFSAESVATARELVDTALGIYLDQGESLAVLTTFPLERSNFWVIFQTTHFSRYGLAFAGYALAW